MIKIIVKSKKFKFYIIIPIILVSNKLSAIIFSKIIKSIWVIDINYKDLLKIFISIKKYRKNNNILEVVNVISKEGDIMHISF